MDDRKILTFVLVGPDEDQAHLFEISKDDEGLVHFLVNTEEVTKEVYELCLRSAELHIGFPEDPEEVS